MNKLNDIKNYILNKIKNDTNIKILTNNKQNIINELTLNFKQNEFENVLNLINNTYQQKMSIGQKNNLF